MFGDDMEQINFGDKFKRKFNNGRANIYVNSINTWRFSVSNVASVNRFFMLLMKSNSGFYITFTNLYASNFIHFFRLTYCKVVQCCCISCEFE
jgi:hypothetical protein